MKYQFAWMLIAVLTGDGYTSVGQILPISPARTISFSTDEGTYMDVDVAPDGRTMAFGLLGDLYEVPVTGGAAKQITRGLALHLRPVWSPDGERIACISDRSGAFHLNVFDLKTKTWEVLGQGDTPLSYGIDPVWAPDGSYISVGDSIYGIAGRTISTGINFRHPMEFSPNGKFSYQLDSDKIYRCDRRSNTKIPICAVPAKGYALKLSPDGRWLCYVSNSNGRRCLMVQDIQMNLQRLLVASLDGEDPRYQPLVPFPHYSFSPDSRNIFIAFGGKIRRIDVESGQDKIIPFAARVSADLGSFDYHTFRVLHDSVQVRYMRSTNCSVDGKRLVFSALDRIYVKQLPNGPTTMLAPQETGQFQPTFSPDGAWVAYVSWCDTAGGFLWKTPASGGRPEQLTTIRGEYQRPVWSPDGKEIAVIRGVPKLGDRDDRGIGELEIIPANGGPIRVVDDSVPLWNTISFSADGSKIVFSPKRGGARRGSLGAELIEKDLISGVTRPIVFGSGNSFFQEKALSPDGRYLVYSEDEDLYLMPIRKVGDSIVMSVNDPRPFPVRFANGVEPYWEKGGRRLAWTYGNRFYRIDPDKVMRSAEVETEKYAAAPSKVHGFLTVHVEPDEVIDLNIKARAFYARGQLALRNARVISMRGKEVIEHGTIVIRDGRIVAVGPVNTIAIPTTAKILNCTGLTVMPGLIDVHLHMRVPSNIFPEQSWMFLVNLAYGVTTARDPASSFDSFGYGELLRTGQMMGPRLFTVGRPVRMGDGVIRMDNLDDARSVVQKRVLLGATVVKDYLPPPRLQREWLLMASEEAGVNMTNEGWSDPLLELAMIKDGSTGVEHNPGWGDVYQDVVKFVARSGTFFTPTLQVSNTDEMGKEYFKYKYWHRPDEKLRHFAYSDRSGGATRNGAESLEEIERSTSKDTVHPSFLSAAQIDARIRRDGGRVAMGSHGNDEGIGAHNELWALQMGGMSNWEALQAATFIGAEALGVQQDLGSIETGKIADMIVLNGNPLEDIHESKNIRYVIKDGVLYDANTLDAIWPFPKKCPEWRMEKKE